jgi:hypothetical protein
METDTFRGSIKSDYTHPGKAVFGIIFDIGIEGLWGESRALTWYCYTVNKNFRFLFDIA